MTERTATVYVEYHYGVSVDLDKLKSDLGRTPTNADISQEADNIIFTKRLHHAHSVHKVVRDKPTPAPAKTVQRVIRSRQGR